MIEARSADIAVIVAYTLFCFGIGARYFKQSSTTTGFSLGSGTIPSWAIGLSILGTYVSSISFIGYPGKAYTENWIPLVFAIKTPLVAHFAAAYFVPLFRSLAEVSAYGLLERRLGPWARTYASSAFLVLQLGRVAVILYLVALVISPVAGLSVPTLILGLGLLVTVYTLLGGIEGVIWIDVIQVIIMLAGALWCLVQLILAVPDPPFGWVQIATEHGSKFSLGSTSWRLDQQTIWGVFLYGVMTNLQNFGIDQNFVQRYLAAKTEAEARRALIAGAWPFVGLSALFLAVGTALYAFYRFYPERLGPAISGDAVLPYFIRTELPAGAAGLLAAAILAAAMSTVSSSLNCMATVTLEDFFKRWFQSLQKAQHSSFLRVATLFWGLSGAGLGLLVIGHRSGLDLFWQISAAAGSGMLGLLLLAVARFPCSAGAAKAGTFACILIVTWANLSQLAGLDVKLQLDPLVAGLLGTHILVGCGWVGGGLQPLWRFL